MKKFLPKTINNKKGFTLIELLVVIAIIAVLSIMAFAVFNGLTGRGNDARRSVDIKAVGDALEVKRGTGSVYVGITANDLSGGIIPQEPARTAANLPKYCYTDGTAVISNPSAWTATDCPATVGGNGTAWMVINNSTVPTVSATATFFKICSMDEAKAKVTCVGSKQ